MCNISMYTYTFSESVLAALLSTCCVHTSKFWVRTLPAIHTSGSKNDGVGCNFHLWRILAKRIPGAVGQSIHNRHTFTGNHERLFSSTRDHDARVWVLSACFGCLTTLRHAPAGQTFENIYSKPITNKKKPRTFAITYVALLRSVSSVSQQRQNGTQATPAKDAPAKDWTE